MGVNGLTIKDYGGAGFNNLEAGVIIMEFAKKDASIASFITVHNCIGAKVVDQLGDLE